jgi:hypothetical protein
VPNNFPNAGTSFYAGLKLFSVSTGLKAKNKNSASNQHIADPPGPCPAPESFLRPQPG